MREDEYAPLVDQLEARLARDCGADDAEDTAVVVLVMHKAGLLFSEQHGGRLQTDWIAGSAIGSNMCESCLSNLNSNAFTAKHRVISMRQKVDLTHELAPTLAAAVPLWRGPYVLNAYDAVWTLARAIDDAHRGSGGTSRGRHCHFGTKMAARLLRRSLRKGSW